MRGSGRRQTRATVIAWRFRGMWTITFSPRAPGSRWPTPWRPACGRAGTKGHILNLGHGLLKDTPVDNVCRLIETARTVFPRAESSATSQES